MALIGAAPIQFFDASVDALSERDFFYRHLCTPSPWAGAIEGVAAKFQQEICLLVLRDEKRADRGQDGSELPSLEMPDMNVAQSGIARAPHMNNVTASKFAAPVYESRTCVRQGDFCYEAHRLMRWAGMPSDHKRAFALNQSSQPRSFDLSHDSNIARMNPDYVKLAADRVRQEVLW